MSSSVARKAYFNPRSRTGSDSTDDVRSCVQDIILQSSSYIFCHWQCQSLLGFLLCDFYLTINPIKFTELLCFDIFSTLAKNNSKQNNGVIAFPFRS